MAALARASPLLALLPALLTRAGAPAAGEAALEQAGGECAAAMRVELLQRSPGAPATSLLGGAINASAPSPSPSVRVNALCKSTLAVSSIHVGKSMAFKRFFLPVITEQELTGVERADFLRFVKGAIEDGAALPDTSEYSSQKFDPVSWKEDCGRAARVRLATVLGEGFHQSSRTYGSSMSLFELHGVYAAGHGGAGEHPEGISHREVGGLTVRHVERIFQEELGDIKGHSPWMDIHAGIYDNDLDTYAHEFLGHGVPVTALRWPSAGRESSGHFYSLIVHVPDTQEIFEFISAFKPSDPRLAWGEFPMARHVFTQDELTLLIQASGPTQLHISRTHYDLDAVKAHYLNFFQLEPLHEVRNEDTGVSFVSFWHQSLYFAGSSEWPTDVIRVQVMYWNTPDQSKTVAHTTEWLERRLEQLNSQYMKSYTSCWPIWGDNHYTVVEAEGQYVKSVMEKYDKAGIGYMAFKSNGYVTTTYFPLPGGFYLELQPSTNSDFTLTAPEDMKPWIGAHAAEGDSDFTGPPGSADVITDTTTVYCYTFVCPP